MADDVVYLSKLLRLPLLAADGSAIGTVTDAVLGPGDDDGTGESEGEGPAVHGFVASVQRRPIFVATSRLGWPDARGLQLTSGAVDLRRFESRGDELWARTILGQAHRGLAVRDIGVLPSRRRTWRVTTVALQQRGLLRTRGPVRVVGWHEAAELFAGHPVPEAVRALRRLHPADAARRLLALAPAERTAVLDGLADPFLADVLEELPEPDQVELLDRLDLDRAADVVEEMDPDDATDLLGELGGDRRRELLGAIEPTRGARLERLLSHDAHSAGGLMTSDPVVVTPTTPVAEALARIRHPDLPAALAAQVFVTEPPTQTPTGAFQGVVGFQRLLREAPGHPVSACLEHELEPVDPDLPEQAVARRLASYDLVAVAVCDTERRLLGVVTVDDVLDRSLPADWRRR